MSNISDIVNVDISIEQPVTESQSYSNMLIVTDAPATPIGTIPTTAFKVESITKLTGYGWLNGTTVDPICKAFNTAMSQSPKPNAVYVVVRQAVTAPAYDSTATYEVGDYCTHSSQIYRCIVAITTPEAFDSDHWEESEGIEPIATTLTRASGNADWYGFTLAVVNQTTDMLTGASTWAEANSKLFGFAWVTGTCPITLTGLDRTFAIFGGSTEDGVNNLHVATAWMAKCFGYEAGSETWAHKSLGNVSVSQLTDAEVQTIKSAGANFYQKYANQKCTLDGKLGSGEWIDIIRFRDWLVNELRVNLVALFANNTKIPYTDAGITAIENVITEVLKRGQTVGGIAQNEYGADDTITYGYTVSVPRAYEVPATTKQQRKLTGVTFTAKLAGAIHYAEISGRLVY